MDNTEEVLSRLDTLIRLQANLAVANMTTQKEQILFLNKAGMGPKAIAEVLSTTSNTVSVALANAKKAASASKKGKVKDE
jgi:DNA-binding NarL/FixJ family response regulator